MRWGLEDDRRMQDSRSVPPRAVEFLLTGYARPLGLSVSPHMLRHSCAKDKWDRGVPPPAIQVIMVHESGVTTMRYGTSSPEDLRRAVERDVED